jgi:hypothetical protein
MKVSAIAFPFESQRFAVALERPETFETYHKGRSHRVIEIDDSLLFLWRNLMASCDELEAYIGELAGIDPETNELKKEPPF